MRRTLQVPAIVCAAALFGAACSSGGSSKASGPTTTLAPSPATELRSLVAFPPPPFEPVTDAPSVALEIGKPGVKEPSLPFASNQQLSNAGFQRGWESIFGTPDGAVVLVNILQFGTRAGPVAAQKLFLSKAGPQRRTIEDIPAVVEIGRSPRGLATFSTAFARGRYLVVLTVGGPPDKHDYTTIMNDLAHDQARNIPAS